MKYLALGSYSNGTHKSGDILDNVFYEIKRNYEAEFLEENASDKLELLYKTWKAGLLAELMDEGLIDEDGEEMAYLVNEELFTVMDNLCPPHCYFGAHIGDGSDFGVWVEEDIQQTIWSGEVPSFDEYQGEEYKDPYFVVNDHGNVTYYENGEEVWAVV